ncbi:10237_t:CDS:2, partial [Acaulospora morrowiae]
WLHMLNEVYVRWNKGESVFAISAERTKDLQWTFNQSTITLGEISDVRRLASIIDKIELPDRFASILVESRILQHVFICDPQRVMVARVDYWIDQCLMDLVHCGDNAASKSRLGNFFLKLVTMTEFLKELVPAVHEFLTKYVHSWNGLEYQEQIFKLLTFLRPGTFDQIYTGFLEPLNKLFVVSTASWK